MHSLGTLDNTCASCFKLILSIVFHSPIEFSMNFFRVPLTIVRHSQIHIWALNHRLSYLNQFKPYIDWSAWVLSLERLPYL